MNKICILTDEVAQFLDLGFDGQELVQLMPMTVDLEVDDDEEVRPTHLPQVRRSTSIPRLISPSVEDYQQAFLNLAARFRGIVAVLSSSGLTSSYRHAVEAARLVEGQCEVEVVDTGAIGIGQGILAAAAASQSAAGAEVGEIKKHLLGIAESVYAVLCIRNLAYLERLGLINQAQAYIGEMLEVHQLFYLNAGTLVPVQKIRNSRHMVESILEFVSEFVSPKRVALQQAASGFHQEARTIRERLTLDYPEIGIHEMAMSLQLGALLGPEAFGLFLWEIEP